MRKSRFVGLHLHGANCYFIDHFSRGATNNRRYKYGVSIQNNCGCPLMVIDELLTVFGLEKVVI